MPTTTRSYAEGPANKTVGGVPTMHYFDFASKGRGQVIRLLFEDAGIAYDDVRYDIANEYPAFKAGQLAEWNPLATIPVIELNGRILTQSYAILRHFARVLGAYDGRTEDERFFADRVADVGIDWRSAFVDAFLSPNKDVDYPKHCAGKRVQYLKGLDRLIAEGQPSPGPFVVGRDITYADLVIYQIAHDEGLSKDGGAPLKQEGYTRLAQLVAAVEARPRVAAFLKSDRYKG